MVQYKLIYFNFRGRAEVDRLIFAVAGEKYEDSRIERETQWPELKPKTPFGQLPVLEITEDDGTVTQLAQSITIARYLARKYGLSGKDELETAFIDMYGDQVTDFLNEIVKVHFESDENRKKELQEKLSTQIIPQNLKFFDDRLSQTGSGFLAPSGLSWADLHLFNVIEFFGDKKAAIVDNFSNVKVWEEKIRAHPKIAAWLASRPVTDH